MQLVILAYFLCYLAFSATTKQLGKEAGAVALLCASVLGCAAVWFSVLLADLFTRKHRSVLISVLPRLTHKDTLAASAASVVVLVVSTLAYSTPGVSLLVPLLLMKGGVLLWGPVLDSLRGDKITSRNKLTLLLAVVAVAGALWHKVSVSASLATATALMCAVAYVVVYYPKLSVMSRYRGDREFLYAELTTTLLMAVPVALGVMLWRGAETVAATQTLLHSPKLWLLSAASEGCALFGGLLFVAQIQSTLAVTLSRCTSLLGGFCATLLLWVLGGGRIGTWLGSRDNVPEMLGVLAMVAALALGGRRRGGSTEIVRCCDETAMQPA